MKANAPDNLYLHPTAKGKVGASWLTFPLTNEDIEYTRTDAFIEKAVEFIGLNVCDYIDFTHKGGIEHLELQERFIRKFREAMKL